MRRGFSLIEVLIAVMVLAVGLLGLGAVFPAVIGQQRRAIETTEAQRAIDYARVRLIAGELADFDAIADLDGVPSVPLGRYEWDDQGGGSARSFTDFDPATGELTFPDAGVSGAELTQRKVPVRARLFPPLFSGAQPRYVWDALTHRNRSTERLEIALFIRRIDGGIRPPKGWSLSDAVVGRDPGGDPAKEIRPILPVAMDDDGFLVRPSGKADDVYAVPIVKEIRVPDPSGRERSQDVFNINGVTPAEVLALKRTGQVIVDDFGIVRKIEETTQRGGRMIVRVSPPFRGAELESEWIVLMPDVPVQVKVITIGGGS